MVGVVNQAIEDGVGHGGVGNDFVPLLDRILTGNQRGTVATTVVDDFQEIAVLLGTDGGHAQVVDDQDGFFEGS